MTSAMQATLDAIFPGDIVDAPPPQVAGVNWRSEHRLPRFTPVAAPPRVDPRFQRLMEMRPAPVSCAPRTFRAPRAPHLLQSTANARLWLEQAQDIASDVRLGIVIEPHLVNRLLLDVIPAVERLVP